MKFIYIILIGFCFHKANAQNIKDGQGRMQGIWVYEAKFDSILGIKPKIVGNFVNDTLQGLFQKFDNNGRLRYEVVIYDGLQQGMAKSFDEKGHLSGIFVYENDNLQSLCRFNKGRIFETIEFNRNGRLNGINTLFRTNGKPWIKKTYSDGKLNGEYTTFYRSGRKEIIYYCENDVFYHYVNYNRIGKIKKKK